MFDKERSVAFTGYRTSKLPFLPTEQNISALKRMLCRAVKIFYERGYDTFYSGMCVGTDIWAAQAVLKMKEFYPDLKLICAIPFAGHDKKLTNDEKRQYFEITSNADRVDILKGVIPQSETARAFNERNIYMLDNSQAVIAVCDPRNILPGGTANTVKEAQRRNMKILFVNPQKICTSKSV